MQKNNFVDKTKLLHPLKIKILSRSSREVFDGKVSSVTSVNDKGVFDVLPQHANFVSLINSYIILDEGLPTRKEIKIDRGVMKVAGDVVNIYLGL
ncbi:MAG: hypothetical protein ACD_22C00216G0002 [uncultured bacterium]|nr:MAG: hypothetical protein ACD_22C00216G0002 [uncultured bacterium]